MTFKELQIKLKSVITDSVSRTLFTEIGQDVQKTVKERTKKGYGVDAPNEPQKRLKGLSESYKKQRSRLKRQGKLASDTTENKSNLTKEGKMLDSLDHQATDNSVTIFLKDIESNEKAKYQAVEGRSFMNLSRSEYNKVIKKIEEHIINDIRKKGL